MEVVPKSSSSSPLPPLPSPPTPPPQAPLRLCPAAGMPYQNPFSEEFASRNEALMPCSPVLQALASVSQPSPPPSPAASCAGPIHSARSAAALMEHRALAVTAVAALVVRIVPGFSTFSAGFGSRAAVGIAAALATCGVIWTSENVFIQNTLAHIAKGVSP